MVTTHVRIQDNECGNVSPVVQEIGEYAQGCRVHFWCHEETVQGFLIIIGYIINE